MLSPTVVVPVSLVGAIIDRPHQSASMNVPSVSVGRDARLNTPQRGGGTASAVGEEKLLPFSTVNIF